LHCCIAPMEHISSSRKTDEHVWTEMRNFKKCMMQMYMAEVGTLCPNFLGICAGRACGKKYLLNGPQCL